MKNRLGTIVVLLALLVVLGCALLIGLDVYVDVPLEAVASILFPTSSASGISGESGISTARAIYPLILIPLKFIFIIVVFTIAFIIHRLAWPIADILFRLDRSIWNKMLGWLSDRLKSKQVSQVLEPRMSAEREKIIQYLTASCISILAISAAALLSLGQFVRGESLALLTAWFTAAFAFGARNLLADLFAGVAIIFEDNFAVGEKVEVAHTTGKVQGIVESINLRTMSIRASTGELFVVPNGELRIMRNFSRGRFSPADIKLKILTTDLEQALSVLNPLGAEAALLFPELLAPWQIIDEEDTLGEHTKLTLLIRVQFGEAAELRPRLLALIQSRLKEGGVVLSD